MNEDNVRLVLYEPRNWEVEASALSLNVHTALALGTTAKRTRFFGNCNLIALCGLLCRQAR